MVQPDHLKWPYQNMKGQEKTEQYAFMNEHFTTPNQPTKVSF